MVQMEFEQECNIYKKVFVTSLEKFMALIPFLLTLPKSTPTKSLLLLVNFMNFVKGVRTYRLSLTAFIESLIVFLPK